jgi:hypothetical protein
MFGLDAVNSYFVVVAMAALLVAVLVWQPHRSQRTVVVWLASGVVGVVLGSAASYAGMRLAGYEVTKALPSSPATNAAAFTPSGMEGMASMKGMPEMGESGCPMAKGYLKTIVQKLDLLTGDVGITLTAEQAASVSDCLRDVETPAKMSNGDAKAKYHQLLNLLNANQKARLAAIGLPQPGSDGPGMGSGMPCMMGGGVAAKQNEPPNPCLQDAEAKAFRSLRERFASKGTAPKAETPKAPPARADVSKSPTAKS